MDSPKNSKFEFLNSRIGDLNDHLDEIMDQTAKKFSIIKENITLIDKQIAEENHKAEHLLESKNHYIKLLEQNNRAIQPRESNKRRNRKKIVYYHR